MIAVVAVKMVCNGGGGCRSDVVMVIVVVTIVWCVVLSVGDSILCGGVRMLKCRSKFL